MPWPAAKFFTSSTSLGPSTGRSTSTPGRLQFLRWPSFLLLSATPSSRLSSRISFTCVCVCVCVCRRHAHAHAGGRGVCVCVCVLPRTPHTGAAVGARRQAHAAAHPRPSCTKARRRPTALQHHPSHPHARTHTHTHTHTRTHTHTHTHTQTRTHTQTCTHTRAQTLMVMVPSASRMVLPGFRNWHSLS
jgi:hypothetical protein